jgi:mutator protein MutT
MIEVVSAVIIQAGRILLSQRRPEQDYPLLWESPGGKVEGNESHHQALRRELREELGVDPAHVARIAEHAIWCGEIPRPKRVSVFILLYAVAIEDCAKPVAAEGQGLGWFLPEEMAALRLAPANERARGAVVEHMWRVSK